MARVLMIPQIAGAEVLAESDRYSHDCLLRALRALEPTFAYWWLRQEDEGRVPAAAGEACVYREPPLGFYPQMAALDLRGLVELFSWQRGLYPVDAVFCSRAAVGPLLSLALADMAGQYPVPVVLTEPRVYGPGERGHNQRHPTQLALRAAGYATCFGVYWSAWEREQALEAARQYCAPAVVRLAEERSFVVDALVDAEALAEPTWRKSGPRRLLLCSRLNANKAWRDVLESYGRVVQSRREPVEVWVHAGTGAFAKLGPPADHRWHRTSERLPRQAYLELLRGSHVGAYLSRDEGANVTTQEMLAAGVVLALPRRPWVERLFAPLRYPYLVGSAEELPALLDWLLDHWEEAVEELRPFRELIRRERSWPAFLARVRRLWQAVGAVRRPPAFRVFRRLALEELERRRRLRRPGTPEAVPFSSLLGQVPRWQTGEPRLSEVRSMRACYEAVRDLDDLTTADPWLRAPEKPAVGAETA